MEKGNMQMGLLAIAVSIVLLGWFAKSGVENFKAMDRVVTVKGLAEREVPADRVIWPLTYKEIGNDLLTIYNNIEKNNAIIVAFLESNGVTASEITVSSPVIIDMRAERYAAQTSPYRYNVTSVITVSTHQVELARKLMREQTDLLKKGVAITAGDYQYNTQYLYTKLNDIKPEMIEEATRNARLAADKFAEDSQSSLGKIKEASQGQFSITDRDANTPEIKVIRVVSTIAYYLKD